MKSSKTSSGKGGCSIVAAVVYAVLFVVYAAVLLVRVGEAALEDGWAPFRLGIAVVMGCASHATIWLAARSGWQAWRESIEEWHFFEEDRQAPRAEPDRPAPKVHCAVRRAADGPVHGVVRARAAGMKHDVRIVAGALDLAPGEAKDVLGPALMQRVQEMCARFPRLQAATHDDALLVKVVDIAATDLATLCNLAGDIVSTLVQNRELALEHAGYRSVVRKAGKEEGDMSAVFERLDSNPAMVQSLDKLSAHLVNPRSGRWIGTIAGTSMVAAGALLGMGLLRLATQVASSGSMSRKEHGHAILLTTAIAVLGVALQWFAARPPASPQERARSVGAASPRGGRARTNKVSAAIAGLFVVLGLACFVASR